MGIKVGISGFGRIGRDILRAYFESGATDVEIVAINNGSGSAKDLAHLFKYDSLYGRFDGDIEVVSEDKIKVNGKELSVIRERSPENIPWKDLGVEIVIDATGAFRDKAGLERHLQGGAKKVILTAPAKGDDVKTVVMGVNEGEYNKDEHNVISNASCTTNCLAPFTKVILEKFGIEKGLMTTVHAYTNDQNVLDNAHSDLRRARAAAESIIPTTTGAAKAVGLVLPEVKGKLNGFAMRVPTPTVSVVDITFEVSKSTTAEEVNAALKEASEGELKGILGFSDEPLVSIDYRKDPRSSIIDGLSTMVIDNMVKVVSWYDNEWGYSVRTLDLARYIASKGI